MRDSRDAVIEILADCEAALIERVVQLTIERDAWKIVALESIHQSHDLTVKADHLRERHRHLLNEYRVLREKLLREAEAA
jgi:hypothetical protein